MFIRFYNKIVERYVEFLASIFIVARICITRILPAIQLRCVITSVHYLQQVIILDNPFKRVYYAQRATCNR